MNFEFDPVKSKSNKKKHGIDFIDAETLWADPDLLEIPVTTTTEERFLVVGKIDGKHGSGIITHRGENIRIISARRARKEEIGLYES